MSKVGQFLKAKSGQYYIKAEADIVLKAGDVLFCNTPQSDVEYLVANGKITQEEGEVKLSKIPEFVKFNIKQPGNTQTL